MVRDFPRLTGKSSQERPNVMIRVFWDIRGTGSRREEAGASGGRERMSERGGDGLELERAIGSA